MRKCKVLIIAFIIMAINFSATAQEQDEINILFLGNSFTFRHDLNLLVEKVFEEGKPGLTVNTERVVYGGQDMYRHMNYYRSDLFLKQASITAADIDDAITEMTNYRTMTTPSAEFTDYYTAVRPTDDVQWLWDQVTNLVDRAIQNLETLKDNVQSGNVIQYDYVVLQSWNDIVTNVDNGYAKCVKELSTIAQQEGTQVILYMTAPYAQNFEPVTNPRNPERVDMELQLVKDLCSQVDVAAVVPVPLAIKTIQTGGTDMTFRYVNDFHPNQRTAFLTANMFYAAFFNESTEGFDFNTVTETKTHSTDLEPDVELDPDDGPATVVFEGEEKSYLQQMAYTASSSMSGFTTITPGLISPKHYYNYLTERPEWAGFWINVYGRTPDFTEYLDVMAGETDRPKWADMEPSDGVYDFSMIKERLRRAVEMNTYYYLVLWQGGALGSPSWIYDVNGGPVTSFISDMGRTPYYADADYPRLSQRFFDALAAEIASYDQALIDRIAFIQPGFGSTGDRQLYKGEIPAEYQLSKDEYLAYMQGQTNAFASAFRRYEKTTHIRFLWNISNYEGSDPNANEEELFGAWMKAHYNCQLRKQQFTTAIGYMAPNEMDQDRELRDDFFGNGDRWGGNPEFVRGEFNDSKWNTTPMANIDRQLNYYWTGISSVDRGIDAWEGKYAEMEPEYKEAYAFSHRYSYYKKPESSPVAFIALRDVLDYSDGNRFPAATYGTVDRGNVTRINNILSEYSGYGARNDDTEAVMTMGQSQYLLNSTGYNDCVWNVIDRNYRRFITQIDPNETSVGYWRVDIGADKQPYGRFARGFDVASGKNAMYFDVDDLYFSRNRLENDGNLTVKIIYYAEDGGSWSLKYHARDGAMKTAQTVNNAGPGSGWQTIEITLTDALLNNGGERGADLIIESDGQTNCRFHMVELLRNIPSSSRRVQDVDIEQDSIALNARYTIQLTATLSPANATNQSVRWSTSDNLIAAVDDNGLVTAINEGTASIVVTSNDGGHTDTCVVSVTNNLAAESTVTIINRATGKFIKPFDSSESAGVVQTSTESDATKWIMNDIDGVHFYLTNLQTRLNLAIESVDVNSWVIQSSDDSYLAQWSERPTNNGYVYLDNRETGIQIKPLTDADNDTIVHAGGTGWRVQWMLEPDEVPAAVTGVSLSGCPTANMEEGTTQQLTANIAPSDAVIQTVSWSSSDHSVAAINEYGFITAVAQGTATITVTTHDGGHTANCNVTVVPYVLSNDATLSDLTVDGTTVSGFAPATLTYDLELPAGTVDVPVVDATENDANASSNIANASGLPGTATVTVTAEDGTIQVYTVNFTIAIVLSNDATLSDLTVDGTTVSGFAPATLTYDLELPAGTVDVPVVGATENDANASSNIENASGLPGTATVTVTAEDGTTQVYTVDFSVDTTTSIADHKVNNVKVYPNPVSTTLFVENNNEDNSMVQIRIFNPNGQLIHLEESTDKLIAIDLERLPLKGMIMLQVINGERVDMHEVIVQ